jgi:phosphoribosylglycinamide formyltransferase 2
MTKKILLLGSGELGKEFTIAAKRLGQYVIAVDSYSNAPAQQVADESEVIDMLDGESLKKIVEKHKPDIIVPEIEAIRTETFYEFENSGIQVVPSARAANFTMNRRAIRDLASNELGVRTARYKYATTLEEFKKAVYEIGIPCVVKPLMSSSGKGQSTLKNESEIEKCFDYGMNNSRGDVKEMIVEEFIKFHTEITLLTVTQKNGETLYCPPIGHRQERGDYQESWQPVYLSQKDLLMAQEMANKVTKSLTGFGLWGVEFFITDSDVVFSELSPRPHDTGMVTLAGTQNLNEFELHLRAILGLPINEIKLERSGSSSVILYTGDGIGKPIYNGLEEALSEKETDVKLFGKPETRKYRRMGVALAYGKVDSDIEELRVKSKNVADKIFIKTS